MLTPLLLAPTLAALATGLTGLPTAAAAQPVAGHAGQWIIDADGRVLLTYGVNMAYKVGSYAPDEIGFDDDAAFLAANGFDSVRLGVIWKALESRPGVYDDRYLDRLAATTETLARHGILTLVDMHQDQYNERFEGEGAPDWAVQDDGLPAEPKLGFGPDYMFMPALAGQRLPAVRQPGRLPGAGPAAADRHAHSGPRRHPRARPGAPALVRAIRAVQQRGRHLAAELGSAGGHCGCRKSHPRPVTCRFSRPPEGRRPGAPR